MPKTRICLELLITISKWFPVLVTVSIFTWGWYAYTFQVVIFSMQSLVQQIICSVIFNIVYVLSFWSYFQTIFTPLGKIPSKFFLSPEISEDLIKAETEHAREEILFRIVKKNDLPVACRSYSGGIRYCEKCNLIKPDRCHHCSICRICVLRMDHHCPWINNCVSFTNYKFFVLFLGYTFLVCVFVASTTLPYFLKYWSLSNTSKYHNQANSTMNSFDQSQDPMTNPSNNNYYSFNNSTPISTKFNILFLTFISSMISLALLLLFCYHIHLILHNRSTLESFRPPLMAYGPDKNAFNLGKKENFAKLFGRSKLLWFMPVYTTEGTGLFYDQRPQLGAGDEEVRQELLNHQNVNVITRPNHDTEV